MGSHSMRDSDTCLGNYGRVFPEKSIVHLRFSRFDPVNVAIDLDSQTRSILGSMSGCRLGYVVEKEPHKVRV